MPLTLAEVATGVEKPVTVKLLDPCDRCEGSGAEPGTSRSTCPTCEGAGEVRRAQRSFFGQVVSVRAVPDLRGRRTDHRVAVQEVPGRRTHARREEQVAIKVPAGVATGQYMTMRGVGNVARAAVRVATSSSCSRSRTIHASSATAKISTPKCSSPIRSSCSARTSRCRRSRASVTLRIPAGTQSGQVFHLRGRGLPRINASGTGDLHVRLQLWTPDVMSDEEAKLLRQLHDIRPLAPTKRERGFWSKVKESLGA